VDQTQVPASSLFDAKVDAESAISATDVLKPPPPDAPTTLSDDSGTELDENLHEEIEMDNSQDQSICFSRRCRISLFVLVFMAVTALVGGIIGFTTDYIDVTGNKAIPPMPSVIDDAPAEASGSPTIAPVSEGVPHPAWTEEVAPPTNLPTAFPVSVQDGPLLLLLKSFSLNGLDDTASPQYQAYQWLLNEDPLTDANAEPARLAQRYSLVTMYTSLSGEIPSYATQNECEWPTVACGSPSTNATSTNDTNVFHPESWQVTEINMARQSFTGTIPPEITLLGPSLVRLDLAENEVSGSIPDETYELTNLKYIYLHNNKMTGSLSENVGKLQVLEELFLGSNKFSGSIPYNIGSRQGIRPLRYLILRDNQFEGAIPPNLDLRKMFHLDLSFNNLSGPLPPSDGFSSLKQFYLDHNQFTGTIPESYPMIASGRLHVLALNDNMLTGGLPTGWVEDNKFIDTITVQNNSLTESIDKSICKLSAFQNGELVELGAECDICSCDLLCKNCY
jgi:Leucine-rich repeat (LRR) protein